jgi:hypothetical protein
VGSIRLVPDLPKEAVTRLAQLHEVQLPAVAVKLPLDTRELVLADPGYFG